MKILTCIIVAFFSSLTISAVAPGHAGDISHETVGKVESLSKARKELQEAKIKEREVMAYENRKIELEQKQKELLMRKELQKAMSDKVHRAQLAQQVGDPIKEKAKNELMAELKQKYPDTTEKELEALSEQMLDEKIEELIVKGKTTERFTVKDQKKLMKIKQELSQKPPKVSLTNATADVRKAEALVAEEKNKLRGTSPEYNKFNQLATTNNLEELNEWFKSKPEELQRLELYINEELSDTIAKEKSLESDIELFEKAIPLFKDFPETVQSIPDLKLRSLKNLTGLRNKLKDTREELTETTTLKTFYQNARTLLQTSPNL